MTFHWTAIAVWPLAARNCYTFTRNSAVSHFPPEKFETFPFWICLALCRHCTPARRLTAINNNRRPTSTANGATSADCSLCDTQTPAVNVDVPAFHRRSSSVLTKGETTRHRLLGLNVKTFRNELFPISWLNQCNFSKFKPNMNWFVNHSITELMTRLKSQFKCSP